MYTEDTMPCDRLAQVVNVFTIERQRIRPMQAAKQKTRPFQVRKPNPGATNMLKPPNSKKRPQERRLSVALFNCHLQDSRCKAREPEPLYHVPARGPHTRALAVYVHGDGGEQTGDLDAADGEEDVLGAGGLEPVGEEEGEDEAVEDVWRRTRQRAIEEGGKDGGRVGR